MEIIEIFQRLNRGGKTIILVTHDANLAHHAKRIVRLSDGRIVEDIPVSNPLDAASQLESNEPDERSGGAGR